MDARRSLRAEPELMEHARRCPECDTILAGYQTVLRAVSIMPDAPVLLTSSARHVAPRLASMAQPAKWTMWAYPLGVAATVLLCVTAAFRLATPSAGNPDFSSTAVIGLQDPHVGSTHLQLDNAQPGLSSYAAVVDSLPDQPMENQIPQRDLFNRVRGITQPFAKTLRPVGQSWLEVIHAVWETLPAQGDESASDQPAATIVPIHWVASRPTLYC
jgi:hypothetical protein